MVVKLRTSHVQYSTGDRLAVILLGKISCEEVLAHVRISSTRYRNRRDLEHTCKIWRSKTEM